MTDAPDYGEPWQPFNLQEDCHDIQDYNGIAITDDFGTLSKTFRDRIISCVNACRGIANPEEEIPIKSPTTGSMLNEMAAYLESRFIDVTIARHHQGLWTVRLSNQHFHVFCTHSQRLPDAIREALDYVREQQEKAALSPKREG